ncbi:major facilitator superfamily domain-containing protein [Naematelia encephala]|uniref:Major facilitator superfamily domain-containing protein n=1 Tax=Naematelia encephala TaxID=71784 RepID=A0A1Y2ATK9_9TREE|nr:major facilitator superfamily domain-containing protein [Naematelia encephala]
MEDTSETPQFEKDAQAYDKDSHAYEVEEAASYNINPVAEKKLLRKIDFYVLPMVTIVYWVSFLDRSNISNAKAAGLVKDLKLGTYDFNIGACLYYVIYMCCEPFAGLLIKRFGFILVPISIFAFSSITLGTTWIHNKHQFFAVRCLLGMVEAFTMPGLSYMLSRYYRRHELAVRFGIFMLVAAGTSQAFGGLISGALVKLGHIGSIKSWRLIFLVEGIVTLAVALFLIVLFPSDPTTTRLFNAAEKDLARRRIEVDSPPNTDHKEPINWPSIKQSFVNLNMFAYCFMYITNSMTVQGLGIFTTSILEVIFPTATSVHIQYLSVGPQAVGAFIGIVGCWLAGRYRRQGYGVIAGAVLCLIAYIILIATPHDAGSKGYANFRFFALFIGTGGGYMYGPCILGWALSNASPDTMRSLTGAFVTGVGSLGSIAATWSYVATDAHTGYRIGNALNIAMAASVILVCVPLIWYQKRENALREAGGRDYRLQGPNPELLGRHHPAYRYKI